MEPRVNIISVNYNSAEDILQCIFSLRKSTYKSFQLFIVDNQSTDDSIRIIRNEFTNEAISFSEFTPKEILKDTQRSTIKNKEVVLIKNDENKGFAAGNNVALQFLLQERKNEFIWLLNPDVELEPDVMANLVTLYQGRKKLILGNLIHHYANREKIMFCGGFQVKKLSHGINNITQKKNIAKIDAISGASFFTKMDTFRELGLLPETYFMYWEETDFCTLAKKHKYQFDVNTKSKIYDKIGTSSNNNFTREYLYLLNGLRYYKKYYWHYIPLIVLSTFAKLAKAIVFDSKIKKRAVFFGHIDFFKLCLGREIDIKSRIKRQ